MKQRLLVMNGRRILEAEIGGKWETQKVDAAAGLKPKIYNLFAATSADPAKSYVGQILHVDKKSVFQQVGTGYIEHDRAKFVRVPDVGAHKEITYENGQAVSSDVQISKRLTR